MPKGLDIDKIVAEALRRLGQSGVADDAARIGGNMVDNISKALSEATGKTPKPKKPSKPSKPKNPPKSKPLSQKELTTMKADDKYLRSEGRRLAKEAKDNGINSMSDEEVGGRGKNPPAAGAVAPAPKGPKPKSPKSGSADKMEREARREMNRANWAKEREAYNKKKAIERQERKNKNRDNWAATLEQKYGGNIVEARKATSKGRNKKKDAK
jgi:hypothetical protein